MYTLKDDIIRFETPLIIDKFLGRRGLTALRISFFVGSLICLLLSILSYFGLIDLPMMPLIGGAIILGTFWVEQMLLYSYHNSFYFYGLNSLLGLTEKEVCGASYLVAKTVAKSPTDVAKAFCLSPLGQAVLLRSAITNTEIDSYLSGPRTNLSIESIPVPTEKPFSFVSLGQFLVKQDSAFAELLTKTGGTTDTFLGALKWLTYDYNKQRQQERWWGKDNLSKREGIGREWSFGTAYTLEKYSKSIYTSAIYSTLAPGDTTFIADKVSEVEVVLAREKASNVLLIGEPGVGKIDILIEVDKRIRNGKAINAVSDFHLLVLDTTRLFATHASKQELELTLISIFEEATLAGNIIVVIENLSSFVKEAEAMGVFIPELLDPYLATSDLHLVATETPGAYHSHLETLGAFARRFTEIIVDATDISGTTRVLESIALSTEKRYGIIFTYHSLVAISNSADRYVIEGVMPDKAIDLLLDIAGSANQSGVTLITPDFVHTRVSEKTGIPVGPLNNSERDLLLNLEDKLHEQVVGQEKALKAIARTMRRARAGIQASDKPIGSFLFLGPTGVGKTETAKALAKAFFGGEEKLARLDMSEYSGEGSLRKLLGNNETSGSLPDLLREHPYCVLLLDEFEKSSRSVQDLFLQILDEGKFNDGRGEVVNARNTIVIATSNAGSQLILKTVSVRQNLATLEGEIINHIIQTGVYRPELINRFDSTIIFEPLTIEEQGQIAGLMLKGLFERVRVQGYELSLNNELINILVEKGYSPEFGARPMQRAIQNLIEEKVAQKIISGQIEKGAKIILTKADFTIEELLT